MFPESLGKYVLRSPITIEDQTSSTQKHVLASANEGFRWREVTDIVDKQ